MTADFTFWGHNCFLIETNDEALLIDPWLNDTGAFFGSWHQWPPNGHLRDAVQQRCIEKKKLNIFLTHEHQDHFDKATLHVLSNHPQCTVYIPAYKDKFLLEALRGMELSTVELSEGETGGGEIRFRLFIDDGGINHDSSIFVSAPGFTFLNQNDCKLFDRLPLLARQLGPIDYYSVQFSGANWHPACFELPEEQRRLVARKKVLNKLRNVLGGIKVLSPSYFIPAAGPAFFPFLDPAMNAGTGTIFVHQDELEKYLRQNGVSNILCPRPGEQIDEDTNRAPISGPRADEILSYRASHRNIWDELDDSFTKERFAQTLQRRLNLIANIAVPPDTPVVAFNWGDTEDDWLLLDLARKSLTASPTAHAPCLILKASTKYFSLMCGKERWQDIALSMQASVERVPEVYNTIANIFLFADESNLADSLVRSLSLPNERIVIEHQGEKYEIDRYCPHQGGDLLYAIIDNKNVVCPRHSWRFDLACEGRCKTSAANINAVRLGSAD
jgi:UDP-MurNAc hydroxylase